MLGDHIALLRLHLQEYGRRAQQEPEEAPLLLSEAFQDLQSSIDELEVVDDELRQQEDELAEIHAAAERERHRYRDYFHLAPDALLVTDLSGTIEDANRCASILFSVDLRFLIRKPITTYVSIGDRPKLRRQVRRWGAGGASEELVIHLYPRIGPAVLVGVKVALLVDEVGRPRNLLWQIHEIGPDPSTDDLATGPAASAEAGHARNECLAQVSEQINASLDYAATLGNIATAFVPRFAERCLLYAIWDAEAGLAGGGSAITRLMRIHGHAQGAIQELDQRSIGEVLSDAAKECLATGQSRVASRDSDDAARLIHEWDGEARRVFADVDCVAVVPLVVPGRPVAVAFLGGSGVAADRLREGGDLLTEVAERAAVALDHAGAFRRASESSRQRDALISAVSHDLRNPLMVIHGYLHIVGRLLDSKNAKGSQISTALLRMRGAVSQVTRQLDDLTTVARLGAGRPLTVSAKPIDVAMVAREIVADFQGMSDHHRLEMIAPAEKVIAVADRAQIERVVGNLIGNALKYSPRGSLVSVEVGQIAQMATIAVRDEGIGIPSEELPHIFEFFYRASNVAERTRGSGIGLASAAQIIARHGGRIDVESNPGVGSTFTVYLPLASAEV